MRRAVNDETPFLIAKLVLYAELGLPLALGLPVLVSERLQERLSPERRREAQAARATARELASRVPVLAPLVCPACGAAVPLEAEAFACPHCRAEVQPPPAYVAALEDRQGEQLALARAEHVWRWSRWTSSTPMVFALRVFITTWVLAALASVLVLGESLPSAAIMGELVITLLFSLVGYGSASSLAAERAKLPPLPAPAAFRCDTATGLCAGCGAPIRFAADRLATLCPYCGGETFRAALAEAQQAEAATGHAVARASLLDAVFALDERRAELLTFVALIALAEIVYGVVVGLVLAWDRLTG